MTSILQFNRRYFVLAALLFLIELLIAGYVHDKIIRPYIGDLIVVVLIYCFLRSFLDLPYFITALAVLVFSFAIETLQYFHIVDKLGLTNSKYASIVIGTSFAWEDIVAYIIGIALVIFIESTRHTKKQQLT